MSKDVAMDNSADSLPPVGETDESDFRLYALHMVGEVLGLALDLNALLASAMDMFLELTRADAGFIMLMDEEADSLVFGVAKGLKKGVVEKIEVHIEKDIARSSRRSCRPV